LEGGIPPKGKGKQGQNLKNPKRKAKIGKTEVMEPRKKKNRLDKSFPSGFSGKIRLKQTVGGVRRGAT